MITVELYDRSKNRVPDTLRMDVVQYDMDAIGGPLTGAFTVTGESVGQVRGWLGYHVIFRNDNGTQVWWGKIKALSVDLDGLQVDLSLDDIYNRVQVLYTIIDGDGYAVGAQTGWIEDARSVATYGRHELRHAIGEATPTMAAKAAARLLEKFRLPKQQVGLGSMAGATVRCEGLWPSLAQTYVTRPAGREVYEGPDNTEQVIGWGVVSTVTGFTSGAYAGVSGTEYDAGRRAIQRIAGGLDIFNAGDKITVSGSTANNGVKTVADDVRGKVVSYAANTISFDPSDDINDSAGGLRFVELGSYIRVTGSVANNGFHEIEENGANHLATTGAVTAGAAGPAVTIEHGHMLPIVEALATEAPGPTVTLAGYPGLAYSFTLSVDNGTWAASEIWLRVRKIGAPTDGLKVSLYSSNAGLPNSLLDTVTMPAADLIGNGMAWVQFNMPGNVALNYGTTYWIRVERTGANNVANYYAVGLHEPDDGDPQLHSGSLKLISNGSFINRPKAATLPFQVWGHTDTTDQITSILGSESQYTSGVSVRVDSDIPRRTYRDGSGDALSDILDLLDAGTDDDKVLLATVTPDWRVVVDTAPEGEPVYLLRPGPKLETVYGQPIEEGVLPVGQWVAVDGVSEVDAIAPISPFLLGYADYSVRRGGIGTIRAYGASNMFDFARIAQG